VPWSVCCNECVAVYWSVLQHMCCSVLECVATHVLQCIGVCCNTCVAVYSSVLQHMCCSALECVATHVLQCIGVCCNTCVAVYWSVLQHMCCSVLECVAIKDHLVMRRPHSAHCSLKKNKKISTFSRKKSQNSAIQLFCFTKNLIEVYSHLIFIIW